MSQRQMLVSMENMYETRNKCPVRLYSTSGGGKYPVHGALWQNREWHIASWTAEGRMADHLRIDNRGDLVEVKPERWHTIKQDVHGNLFFVLNMVSETREDAMSVPEAIDAWKDVR